MKLRTADREQLIKIFQFMQRNDPNGDYMSYLDDIEAGEIEFKEVALSLIQVLRQWKIDLHIRTSPLKATLNTYELILVSMI